jgi:hypothetical protein
MQEGVEAILRERAGGDEAGAEAAAVGGLIVDGAVDVVEGDDAAANQQVAEP